MEAKCWDFLVIIFVLVAWRPCFKVFPFDILALNCIFDVLFWARQGFFTVFFTGITLCLFCMTVFL